MFEDEDEISQGYGNAQDLMPQDPAAAQGGGGQGGDPIMAGVQAFVETQDPQIAVEVVTMLAEQMGLSAAPAPAGPAGGGAPMGGGNATPPAAPAPMGANGMTVKPRLFR